MRGILILFIVSGLAFGQNEVNRAVDLFKQGKYQEAIPVLEEAIATRPDWYFPVLLKAQCHGKLNQHDKAIDGYKFVLSMELPDQELVKTKYYLAQTYLRKKDYAKAAEEFQKLAPSVPESKQFEIHFYSGQCLVQLGKTAQEKNDLKNAHSYYSQSIRTFSEALKHQPPDNIVKIEAAFQKAYAQFRIGNLPGSKASLESSISSFKEVLSIDPKHKETHQLLVEVAFRLVTQANGDEKVRRYAQAVQFTDGYLKIWPNDVEMLDKKAKALQGAKRYDDATAVYQQVVSLSPKDGKAFFNMGSCQMASKNYNAAITSFEKAIALGERTNHNTYLFIAYCYRQQKNGCNQHDIPIYEKAVAALKKGITATNGNGKIEKDYDSTQNNLDIFRANQQTDENNRQAMLDNIKAFDQSIKGNTVKLEREREKQLKQNTADLEESIKAFVEQIKKDQEEMQRELTTLKKSYDAAKACGGASASRLWADMEKMLQIHGML
jgi:tetratricopeptide (TPR) repeat protein